MQSFYSRCLLTLLLLLGVVTTNYAQILQNKLRKLGEKAVEKVIDQELEEDGDEPLFDQEPARNNEGYNPEEEENMVRVKGKGLTPPNATEHIDNATAAVSAAQLSAARNEIQQALMAVEVALGQQLLKSLPETVAGMDFLPEEDEVVSMGIGFVGLAIYRAYKGNNRKMRLSVVNNNTLFSQYRTIIANPTYVDGEQDYKVVTIQGHQGAITFDGDNEYDLGIPLGQNSLFLIECVNFPDEGSVKQAANAYDLNNIEKQLGDQ